MKNFASFRGDFEYICGQIFTLDINGELYGDFRIDKCNPTKNIYILNSLQPDYSGVESIEINRFKFENSVRKSKGPIIKLEIYDFDDTSKINYIDQNEQGLTK
ncbi:MAG: hypothetical protein IJ371_02300 [Clostridia bacterium]|nr:hypothetical protein [Clostridia bacterium]